MVKECWKAMELVVLETAEAFISWCGNQKSFKMFTVVGFVRNAHIIYQGCRGCNLL